MQPEPITFEECVRYTAKPIDSKYQAIWDLYKKQQEVYWTAEEIKYTSKDVDDFNSLSSEEQHFLKQILAFFASSDGIVNYNLSERFTKELTPQEIKTAYAFQMMMENTHAEVYADLILNIIKDKEEQNKLLNAFKEGGPVKKMMDWAVRWIQSQDPIGVRLIAFGIVEGVFFSGMFASLFWLKKFKGQGSSFLEAIITSNKFISRDEGLHVEFACEVYKHIVNKVPQEKVHDMFREANEISAEFMTDALQIDMVGINSRLMKQYINYVSDMILGMLGYDKLFGVSNPFSFMDTIALHSKESFFEMRISTYQSAHNQQNCQDTEFKILEDF